MSEYAKRDHMALGEFYVRHVSALTAENLHSKSAIAGELANVAANRTAAGGSG